MEIKKKNSSNVWIIVLMIILSILFIAPIIIVLMNSFKGQFYISDQPFRFPDEKTFAGFKNYVNGVEKVSFISALGYSLFITVFSVAALVLFTSMTAFAITRIRGRFVSFVYYAFVFSMIVPFQMVMFTMSKVANVLKIDNAVGIIVIYLGFGAGLSVFMFSGFIKGIPLDIEEAAMIDGCNPIQTYFRIVFPILKPTAVTVAILNSMWIWNDYLLPTLVIGSKYKTIPLAVQYLQGGYGSRDMGALMAMLILSIIPVVIFYLTSQKYIISGVIAGAVKG